jgi:hypothetical protein
VCVFDTTITCHVLASLTSPYSLAVAFDYYFRGLLEARVYEPDSLRQLRLREGLEAGGPEAQVRPGGA